MRVGEAIDSIMRNKRNEYVATDDMGVQHRLYYSTINEQIRSMVDVAGEPGKLGWVLSADLDWELVPQEVSFMTAFHAFRCCNRDIKCRTEAGIVYTYRQSQEEDVLFHEDLIDGAVWYIVS